MTRVAQDLTLLSRVNGDWGIGVINCSSLRTIVTNTAPTTLRPPIARGTSSWLIRLSTVARLRLRGNHRGHRSWRTRLLPRAVGVQIITSPLPTCLLTANGALRRCAPFALANACTLNCGPTSSMPSTTITRWWAIILCRAVRIAWKRN